MTDPFAALDYLYETLAECDGCLRDLKALASDSLGVAELALLTLADERPEVLEDANFCRVLDVVSSITSLAETLAPRPVAHNADCAQKRAAAKERADSMFAPEPPPAA
jgi:hypothetical protein